MNVRITIRKQKLIGEQEFLSGKQHPTLETPRKKKKIKQNSKEKKNL
jgi:hypothetical protein